MKKIIALTLAIVMFFCNYTVLFAAEIRDLADLISSGFSQNSGNEFAEKVLLGDRFSQIAATYTKDTVLSEDIKADEAVWTIVNFNGDTVFDAWKESKLVVSLSDFAISSKGHAAREKIELQHEMFKKQIESEAVEYEYGYSYALTSNGLAVKLPYGDITKITKMPEVSSVRLVQYYSAPVSAQATGTASAIGGDGAGGAVAEDRYDGAGMFVAVVDTGLDVAHPAFSGDNVDLSTAKVSVADINSILTSTDAYYFHFYSSARAYLYADTESIGTASNVYYGNKLVFAYDYGNNDTFVTPTAAYMPDLDHGTHTTGTIAGYVQDEKGNVTFSGVLPQAQIAFMKVFTETQDGIYTTDSAIAAAIEDSIMLNVDAINISLGSACGFAQSDRSDNYIALITKYASEVGISVQVAAGNGFNSAYNGRESDYPLATNPDYGSVNAPSSYDYNLSVGSYDGSESVSYGYYLDFDGKKVLFNTVEKFEDFVKDVGNGQYDWMYIERGLYEDFKGADGKICVVQINDTISESEQYVNARRNNAKAVVFVDDDYRLVPTCNNNVYYPDLPYCIITKESGEVLSQNFKKTSGKVKVHSDQYGVDLMSVFSAWGGTGSLTLKPEIVGVGGNVYSTLISEKTYSVYTEAARKYFNMDYGRYSGTSMAAPSVTGYIVKIRQHLQELGITDPNELTSLAATLLMCTATGLTDINGNMYSPRYQGAGAANVSAAVNTNAYLQVVGSEKPKLELGDDPDKTGIYPLSFKLVNTGSSSLNYRVDVVTMTDSLLGDGKTISLNGHILDDCTVSVTVSGGSYNASTGVVTVSGNSTASILVKIELSSSAKKYIDDNFKNGSYVEGFVKLHAVEADSYDLSIPYLAFYGDWDVAPMMDVSAYDTDATPIMFASYARGVDYYGTIRTLGYYPYVVPEGYEDRGFDPNLVCISGSDSGSGGPSGIYSLHSVCFGLLRNAAVMEYSIVDSNTGEVYSTYSDTQIIRAAYSESSGYIYPAIQNISFGYGRPSNTQVTISVTAKLGYDSDEQNTDTTWAFDLFVDDEAPQLYSNSDEKNIHNGIRYDKDLDKYILTLNVYDNHCLSCVWLMVYGEDGYEDVLSAPIPLDTASFKPNVLNKIEIDVTPYMDKISTSNTLGVILEDASKIQSGFALPILVDYEAPEEGDNNDVPAFALEADDNVNIAVGYSSDLGVVAYPSEASYTMVSDNPSVAFVDPDSNLVVGRSEGKATITISSGDIVLTRDVYVYTIDGEWRYEIISDKTVNYKGLVCIPENMGKIMINAYYGDGTHVEIPRSFTVYNEKTGKNEEIEVVAVGPYAFAGAYLIKSLKVPNTINFIGWYAFTNCIQLEKIEFEKNSTLSTIDTFAFDYCRSLKAVTIPASVTAIESRAFARCYSLEVLEFEEGSNLKKIDSCAFMNSALESIVFPEKLESIGSSAFSGCEKLKSFTAPASLVNLYSDAFSYCYALETVDMTAAKVTFVGPGVFHDCTSLRSVVGVFDNVTSVPSNFFARCTELVYVELNDNIKSIDYGAFSGCYKLIEVYLGDSMKEIGDYAFRDCYSLRTVVIAAQTDLKVPFGKDAFLNCSGLEKITVDPANQKFMSDEYGILYVKDAVNSVTTGAKPITYWTLVMVPQAVKIEEFHLRGDVTGIAAYAFTDHTELKKVFIPADSALLSIGAYAFAYCTSLDYIDLQNAKTLNTIGDYCFAYCISLTDITITCQAIPQSAFLYCVYLKNINLPDNFGSVGANAFAYCIRLETINGQKGMIFPATTHTLSDNAFYQCRAIKYVDLSGCSGIKHNGWSVFAYCYNLETAKLNPASSDLGRQYFYYCTSLKYTNLSEMTSLENVRTASFYACISLEEAIFPPYVDLIETYVFEGCISLKKVVLPCTSYYDEYYKENGALGKEVVMYAGVFKSCASLREVELPYTLTELPAYTFSESGVISVTIPGSVDVNKLNSSAFYLAVDLQEIKMDYKRNSKTGEYLTDEDGNYIENEYYETIDGVLVRKYYEVTNGGGKVMYEYPAELMVYPCGKPADVYTIPEQFTEIPEKFFMMVHGTNKVVIPSTVTTVANAAFYYAEIAEVEFAADSPVDFDVNKNYGHFMYDSALKKVTLPENLTVIPQGMFYYCEKLEEVNTANVKNVGYAAFIGCTALKEVDIQNVETIDEASFAFCESLKELHFGAGLTSIVFNNGAAFEGCKSLETITVTPSCRYYTAKDNVLYNKEGTVLYVYPANKPGSTFTVPDGVTKIAESAFEHNTNLETVILPQTLQAVGFGAFYHTSKLANYVFRAPVAPIVEGFAGVYCSFYDNMFYTFDIYLNLIRPAGASTYDDRWVYSQVFDSIVDLDSTVTVLDGKTGEEKTLNLSLISNEIPVTPTDYTKYLPTVGTIVNKNDYKALFNNYVDQMISAHPEFKTDLEQLKKAYAEEMAAFDSVMDERTSLAIYQAYMKKADALNDEYSSLYSMKWSYIHKLISYASYLTNTYAYQSYNSESEDDADEVIDDVTKIDFAGHVQHIAYSGLTLISYCNTAEEIVDWYGIYKTILDTIPKSDDVDYFWQSRTETLQIISKLSEQLTEDQDLYSEEARKYALTELAASISSARAAYSYYMLFDARISAENVVSNLVKKNDEAVFNQYKDLMKSKLDVYREENYLYASWFNIKNYIAEQKEMVDNCYTYSQVYRIINNAISDLDKCDTILDDEKQEAIDKLNQAILFYDMRSSVSADVWESIKNIVKMAEEAINNATVTGVCSSIADGYFDVIWNVFNYNKNAYVIYREFTESLDRYAENANEATLALIERTRNLLGAVSYKVGANSGKIEAIMTDFRTEYGKINGKENALGEEE